MDPFLPAQDLYKIWGGSLLKLKLSFLLIALILSFGFVLQPVSAASFNINNTTPFLGESITITGNGLIANHDYYLYDDEGGPYLDYTDTTYQGVTAKLFSSYINFGTGSYYSHEYAEFDKVLVFLRYYDGVAGTPYFRIGASDIYWTNGGGAAQNIDINSIGSSNWVTWTYAFDKDKGVPDFEWIFSKVGSNNVYVDYISKHPMWVVTTDNNGSFSKTINAPRMYSRNVDLNFTFKIYDPIAQSTQTAGVISVNVNYNDFRSAKDMLTLHYVDVRPNGFSPNGGASFANQIRRDVVNYKGIDWDNAFVGAVMGELGRTDLRNLQATRIKDTIRHGTADLKCYSIGGGNYTDCATAGWTTLKPAYEATNDPALYNAMIDILNYTFVGYNATYNNFSQSVGASGQFWIDAGGGKIQFFWYMGGLLGDNTYKDYAKVMINTMIDKLQTPDGWFYQSYYFTTDTTSSAFWDGGQGWALNGLREFRDLIINDPDEQALVLKINNSLERAADNLSSRPISDLRSDYRRSSVIAYNLYKLAQDTNFPEVKRTAWNLRAEELFILALQTMNGENTDLNRYGLTYTVGNNYMASFSDYYMLKILNYIYPNAEFYPNNIGSEYSINKQLETNNIYQAYLDNVDGWSTSAAYYNEVGPSGNTIKGTSEPGRVVKYLQRDMTATASSGNVDIAITEWTGSNKEWTEQSEDHDAATSHTISGLLADTYYNITKNGVLWHTYQTDGSGNLVFSYNEGYSTVTFSVEQDTIAPTGGSLIINSGSTHTDRRDVSLTISTDQNVGAIEMEISENSNFAGAAYEAYATSKNITLSSGDGVKTIYIRFKDISGNESNSTSDSIILDTTSPTILITSIGLISHVANRTTLAYYFPSQTPTIRGISEADSTIHFNNGLHDYTTTTDDNGGFEITLANPDLTRNRVTLTYYSEDGAGHKSDERTLILIVGIENFPSANIELTTTPNPTDEEVTPTPIIPVLTTFLVEDENGKLLSNVQVIIDGQKYTSDSAGAISLEGIPGNNAKILIIYNDKQIPGKILGTGLIISTTADSESTTSTNNSLISIIAILLLLGGGSAGYYFWKRKKSYRS